MAKRPGGIRAFLETFRTYDLDRDALRGFDRPVYFALGGLSNPDEVLQVPGAIQMGGVSIHDAWDHGVMPYTTTGVFGKSSNVGTLMLAQRIGPERYYDMLGKFGLGQRANVGLPGEIDGLAKAFPHIRASQVRQAMRDSRPGEDPRGTGPYRRDAGPACSGESCTRCSGPPGRPPAGAAGGSGQQVGCRLGVGLGRGQRPCGHSGA